MSQGRSLRLFLVDGTPNGLLTAEIMNWTGHVRRGREGVMPRYQENSLTSPVTC